MSFGIRGGILIPKDQDTDVFVDYTTTPTDVGVTLLFITLGSGHGRTSLSFPRNCGELCGVVRLVLDDHFTPILHQVAPRVE